MYNMKIFSLLMLAGIFLGVAIGGIALAQSIGEQAPQQIPPGPQTGTEFLDAIRTLTDWLFVLVMVGAGVFIVLAGWQFISGGGEPQAVTQARQKLLWAVMGILVALLARGTVFALQNLIGA